MKLVPRMMGGFVVLTMAALPLSAAQKSPAAPPSAMAFTFKDVGVESGLLPDASGIRGHAAGWGDVDSDGFIDLYVGAFHTEGSKPSMFFRNVGGKFRLDNQPALRASTRPTGSVFADLDNDGDLDLYVSSMPAQPGGSLEKQAGHPIRGCILLRNDGDGKFTDVSAGNGACPPAFGGRSATVLDFDGDGLLDLLVGEDPLPGYNGSTTKSSRLFRNRGNLQFDDASRDAGLPADVPGYGVAAADVNNDGWPDFFVAANHGGNLLFLNDGKGKFREAPAARQTFDWKAAKDEMICGVALGDVNRDGLVDLVVGQHFKAPWKTPIANRLYLNKGVKDGVPAFEDVTESAGLVPLPLKGPHVEIQDFDNDGWPDLYTSIVKFAGGRAHPVIFRNLGAKDGGVVKFREDVLALNDFPTAEDRAIARSGQLFDKVVKEKKIIYTAAGPSGDFDNDGKLDLFLCNWWIELPSLLLKNETPGGGWLDVVVQGDPAKGVNRMGVGARVRVYAAGRASNAATLLGDREIATGFGYASAQPAIAHFGLGAVERVDVEVTLPHGKGTLSRNGVKANQRLTIGQ